MPSPACRRAHATKSLQRWIQDGENLKAKLEDTSLVVDLQFANDQVALHVSQ